MRKLSYYFCHSVQILAKDYPAGFGITWSNLWRLFPLYIGG